MLGKCEYIFDVFSSMDLRIFPSCVGDSGASAAFSVERRTTCWRVPAVCAISSNSRHRSFAGSKLRERCSRFSCSSPVFVFVFVFVFVVAVPAVCAISSNSRHRSFAGSKLRERCSRFSCSSPVFVFVFVFVFVVAVAGEGTGV